MKIENSKLDIEKLFNANHNMGKIGFFLFIKPISYLPLFFLYRLADFFYLLVYYVIRYRKKVVFTNLKNAFPHKTTQEITTIAKDFYRHFCDLLIESIKLFSISEKELKKRCRFTNLELITQYAKEGKSLIIPTGHYNNWEMAGTAVNLQIPHQAIVVYSPLKNQFFNKIIKASRGKFGTALLSKQVLKTGLKTNPAELRAIIFAADQSPTMARAAYWTTFLNQETGIMIGSAKYAKQYDYPVVFGKITKVKRGYYEVEFIPLIDTPKAFSYGEITENHTRLLEKIIMEHPQYWLWSHKRWKRKKPLNL
ncbi:MAG: lysophospholipid acyltransferase family protein [Saprospiraceae bacterium]